MVGLRLRRDVNVSAPVDVIATFIVNINALFSLIDVVNDINRIALPLLLSSKIRGNLTINENFTSSSFWEAINELGIY